jgi:hypothetical protein
MKVLKTTPIYVVERIESALPFWKGLGFEATVEVPHEGALGFALLVKDGLEVMLQSAASVAADFPPAAGDVRAGSVILYCDVDSLAAAEEAVRGAPVVVPRRETPYGAREVFVRTPDGQVVGFAEHL